MKRDPIIASHPRSLTASLHNSAPRDIPLGWRVSPTTIEMQARRFEVIRNDGESFQAWADRIEAAMRAARKALP